ncbi:MAG TPA: HD domain-containing phosphohydrolase [Jatrophihabitantaceae bacterium]
MSRHQGLLARVRGFNAGFVLGVPSSCASLMRGASGGFPISGPSLRLGEFVATFALAQDNAFGQPLESQLRSCLLAAALCEEAGLDRELRETVYWVALLRYIGCTGHAHEVATVFGDEIAIRAQTLVHDAANPAEVMRDVLAFATANHAPEEREQVVQSIQAGAHDWAVHNFASGCEVGDMLVRRLDFGPDVRDALRFTFERWNGKGFPTGASGEQIPLAMRIVHLSHDMEALGRLFSPAEALDAARQRRDQTYDPTLADLFAAHASGWFESLDKNRAVGRARRIWTRTALRSVGWDHLPDTQAGEYPDRHVDEEDPTPPQVLGNHAAQYHSHGRTAERDEAPYAERSFSFPIVREARDEGGEGGGRHERCAQTLERSQPDDETAPRRHPMRSEVPANPTRPARTTRLRPTKSATRLP